MILDLKPEIIFETSRSSGPGGQHVNKTETRVTLRFNVPQSNLLNDEQKALIAEKLSSHMTSDGDLLVSSQETRSQLRNKEICLERFYALLTFAFRRKPKRIATKPSKAAKQKRLDGKKILSQKKQNRRKFDLD